MTRVLEAWINEQRVGTLHEANGSNVAVHNPYSRYHQAGGRRMDTAVVHRCSLGNHSSLGMLHSRADALSIGLLCKPTHAADFPTEKRQ